MGTDMQLIAVLLSLALVSCGGEDAQRAPVQESAGVANETEAQSVTSGASGPAPGASSASASASNANSSSSSSSKTPSLPGLAGKEGT